MDTKKQSEKEKGVISMVKVITYGTYDLLHYGHIRLLERAKELGDYLVVGITSDGFDKTRGKINVQQPLMERIEAVRALGIADEIIVEEYEGQKIDDIRRYDIDIFTVGSDWVGTFDYLNEFCKVVYLDRTLGVSSSEIRAEECQITIGIVGDSSNVIDKFARESCAVNGLEVKAICTKSALEISKELKEKVWLTDDFDDLLEKVDAVYLLSHPTKHYDQIKKALLLGKHVLCESPITISKKQCEELFELAQEKNCILMESLKTAYALAFKRLQLLVKTGEIGEVVSVDATCTSLRDMPIDDEEQIKKWGSLYSWGPYALLAVFSVLGVEYKKQFIQTRLQTKEYDSFTKISYVYDKAVASIKVGNGVKSEGELVISGTKGYVYVPAPWWKTDYFEVRYEHSQNNKRYFYQLEGEGIRYMLVSFLKSIKKGKLETYVSPEITYAISGVMEDFINRRDTIEI